MRNSLIDTVIVLKNVHDIKTVARANITKTKRIVE